MEFVVVIMITFIVTLSILFELCREVLNETTGEAFLPILKSLYAELTLLGFIGLILFAVFKMEIIHDVSMQLFGDAEEISELSEQVHMVLFFVMVIFLVQSVFMAQYGAKTQALWHLWEAQSLSTREASREERAAVKDAHHRATSPMSLWDATCRLRLAQKYRLLIHTTVRLRFLEEASLNSTEFDFARYLSSALGTVLGEMVEVPVSTWFALEVVLLLFWQCETHASANARIALWILTGYFLTGGMFVVHGKLRLVLHNYCEPIIKKSWKTVVDAKTVVSVANEEAAKESHDVDKRAELRRRASSAPKRRRSSRIIKIGKFTRCWGVVKNWVRPRDTQVLDETQSLSDRDSQEGEARLAYSTLGIDANDNANDEPLYVDHLWWGMDHKAHFMFSLIRFFSLMISIYFAIFTLLYVDDLLTAYGDEDMSEEARAYRARGRISGGIVISAVALAPCVIIMYKVTRVVEDFTVVANISELKNRRLIETVLRRQKTVAAFEALKIVQCLGSPEMLLKVLAETRDEATSNGAGAADARMVVLSSDQQPPPPLGDVGGDDDVSPTPPTRAVGVGGASSSSSSSSSTVVATSPLLSSDSETLNRVQRLHRASARTSAMNAEALMSLKQEELELVEIRQRTYWQRIYNIFDPDGDGAIDRQNMRQLLRDFSPKMTPEELDQVIVGLDADNSGTITFDEFLEFAAKLSRYLEHVDTEELCQSMFTLIDRDGGGTITVYEMHTVVTDLLNQDLSVEDVFNIIQNIDVDGNGELDVHEFAMLLDKLGIIVLEAHKKGGRHKKGGNEGHDEHSHH